MVFRIDEIISHKRSHAAIRRNIAQLIIQGIDICDLTRTHLSSWWDEHGPYCRELFFRVRIQVSKQFVDKMYFQPLFQNIPGAKISQNHAEDCVGDHFLALSVKSIN